MTRTVAVVRPPGDSFSRAVSRHPERDLIDPGRARLQHAAYCRLLEEAGLDLVVLAPDESHPDSCFTQDPIVVLEGRGLIGRFGEESRRGEEVAIAEALAPVLGSDPTTLQVVVPPATLEGGDLLRLGRRIVVGRSRRTNDAGIRAFHGFADPLGFEVCTADVPPWALHLQTAATAVGDHVVIGTADAVRQPAFEGMDLVVVPEEDRGAANVARAGSIVIAAGDHEVHRELRRRGFDVRAIDLDEFERADGSPTCLSLIVDATASR